MILFILFCLIIGIQFLYLVIFSKTAFNTDEPAVASEQPPVSIVVCAWNEEENLRELLPLLYAQQYPSFEIIIVNDKSEDGTKHFLMLEEERMERLRVIHVDRAPVHIASKKYAITRGIMSAKNEIILLTDADCRPASDEWTAQMVSRLTPEKEIVLGFSPYHQEKGFLNQFIQFETFYTALQYVSFALAGRPYMGVGRNLLYRKSLFLKHKGFEGFLNVLGGDDDLFINKVATRINTAVCLSPESFTYSVPKTTWSEWFHQKRRHLSVGGFYKKRDQLVLGLLAASHLGGWLLFLATMSYFFYTRSYEMMLVTSGIFVLRCGVLTWIWSRANSVLGDRLNARLIPVFDGLLSAYLLVMGFISTFFRKKITWR